MVLLKRYCNFSGSSLLESVIALTIISICLSVCVLVFAAVFTPKTTAIFYSSNNKLDELFYLLQIRNDSLLNENEDPNLRFEEEQLGPGLKKIQIYYKDSTNTHFEKSFYLQDD